MSEQKIELKPVVVRYVCDACGKGEMKPHGDIVLTCFPAKYPHKCDHCGHGDAFTKPYPTVRWEMP